MTVAQLPDGGANELLEAALLLAAQGYRVFPCAGKIPLTTRGCLDANADARAIRLQWTAHPDANIGVATGDGLLVLDVDKEEGLVALEREHGPIPDTLRARTGKGRHYYFRTPQGVPIPNKAGLVPGIDIRGTHGYVICPPSKHASGKRYTWENLGEPVAPAPAWLLELIAKPKRVIERAPEDERAGNGDRPGDDFNARTTWSEILKPAGWTVDHERGDVTYWKRPGKKDEGASATTGHCGELFYVFSSNAQPFEAETGYSRFAAYTLLRHRGDFSAAASDLAGRGFGKTEDLTIGPHWQAVTSTASPAEDPPGYGGSLCAFLGEDEPEDDGGEGDFIVTGIVAAGVPQVFGGLPKTRKSMLAVGAAVSVATGLPLLGRFNATQGRALLLLHEDPVKETRRRLWRLCRGLGLDPRDLEGLIEIDARTPFYFEDKKDVEAMRRTLDRLRPSLVVFDSLSRMHRLDENSRKDMAVITTTWADLSRTYETAVVAIHHYAKNTGEEKGPGARLRGSGDLFALARHVVGVEKRGGVSMVQAEGNLHYQLEPFGFEAEDGHTPEGKAMLTLKYVGNAGDVVSKGVDSQILAALQGGPLRPGELRKAVRAKGVTTDQRAQGLSAKGLIDKDVSGRWRLTHVSQSPPIGWDTGHGRVSTPRDTRDMAGHESDSPSVSSCPASGHEDGDA